MISQITLLLIPLSKAFDLLDVVNLKYCLALGIRLLLEQKGDEDSPLRMGVDAAPGVSFCECGNEERCTLRGLVYWWGA